MLRSASDVAANLLSPEAVSFLTKLHRKFNKRRLELLAKREDRHLFAEHMGDLDFLPETESIRKDTSWKVADTPADLKKRWVEITGPAEPKTIINALNSGADIFMADFEDSLSPTWSNIVQGHETLTEAVRGSLSFTSPEGKSYSLKKNLATLMVRPRGWHFDENHLQIDEEPISASLFDFGLYFFRNAKALIEKGSAPYFYLPKIESYFEARLWNDVFSFSEECLNIPRGTIRATVLIETLWAAFEMEEILYELKNYVTGLNAGRWDYIFSVIKTYHNKSGFILPDREQISMETPFMEAYCRLLVQTCHRRGAYAIGGMAAYVPSRKDPAVNEKAMLKVKEDKEREVKQGFDGTWVAHPDLVEPVHKFFEKIFKGLDDQKTMIPQGIVKAEAILNFEIPHGKITERGLRTDIDVAIQYLQAWLNGVGAVAIHYLMEDTATAEICRTQIWHWIHSPKGILSDGRKITQDLFRQWAKEAIKDHPESMDAFKFLDELVGAKQLPSFLTTKGLERLGKDD